MNINAEFRRNLWLELTPSRLVGMPLVLGLLLLLVFLLDGKQYGEGVARTAQVLFGLLTILWGTRLASEALITEIREHTWDNQRMSVIGPWSMTWGKLLGSTIYPWYGALLCLPVYLSARTLSVLSPVETVVLMIGSGLLSQAVGLLASLQAIRKNPHHGRLQTTAFLVLGAFCGFSLNTWPFAAARGVTWYGRHYTDGDFVLVSLVIFLAWSVFGIYRLLRVELQLRSLPWGWGVFVLFLVVYAAGFAGELPWRGNAGPWQQRLLTGFLITLALTYGTAFCERKDPVTFRRLLQAIGRRRWSQALTAAPLWLSSLPPVVLFCLLLIGADRNDGPLLLPALAMLLLLLRDLGLLIFLNLSRIPKRADMLAVLCLVLLYGVVPTILSALDLDSLAGLFWPRPGQSATLALPAAFGQALVMAWLVTVRWRRHHWHYETFRGQP